MECVIIASQAVTPSLCRYISPSAFIIAVDAGWQQAEQLGIQPDLILGDFDSAPPPPQGGAHFLPAEKNDTDTYFAVRTALKKGASRVTILGGLGGRLDHTLANLQTLHFLAERRVRNLLVDEKTTIRCQWPSTAEELPVAGRYLSVFAAGEIATGVYLDRVKYPLQNATLTPSYPLGISNEFTEEAARITCKSGYLFVLTVDKK